MAQLTFTWPQNAASYAPEDFILSDANREAATFLDHWPEPGKSAALLFGPEASGKTHLARNWAARHGAALIEGAQLGSADSQALWQAKRHAVLEDIGTLADETALFHLLRHAETEGTFLLLTSRLPARELPFTLPDLRSRLLALPAAGIEAPDEALLKGFLFKCFSDHQLRVGEEVIDYIAKRIERSFAAGRAAVLAIEASAAESKKPVTIPLIRPLL
jgi:chromosomal replication initiation ATPase DnaA